MARLSRSLFASVLVFAVVLSVAQIALGDRQGKGVDIPPRLARWLERPSPSAFHDALRGLVGSPDRRASVREVVRAAAARQSSSETTPPGTVSWRALVPAGGDLTGDGKEDALEISDAKLRGVSGIDGRILWVYGVQGDWAELLGVGALDAVAGDDVLIVDTKHVPIAGGVFRWTIRFRGLSGKSGTTLWTRTYENIWSGTEATFTDLDFAIPWGSGDLTGDGRLDQVVGRMVYNDAYAGGVYRFSSNVVFEVVSGATGTVAATFVATGEQSYPDLHVVPDLSGDAAADVVTSSAAFTGNTTQIVLEASSGKGGSVLWRRPITSTYPPQGIGARLNADQKGDLLLANGGTPALRAISGADGADLWSRASLPSDADVSIAGDASGDGGQELLVVTSSAAGGSPSAAATLGVPELPAQSAGSSASGYGPPCYGLRCDPPPCLDGEPGEHSGYGYGFECGPPNAELVRGADGTVLHRYEGMEGEQLEAVGDADADSVGDLLFMRFSSEEGGRTTFGIVSGSTATVAWTRTDPGLSFVLAPGGDLDGDGGRDVVRIDFPSGEVDRVSVLSGKTGEPLAPVSVDVGGYLTGLGAARVDGAAAELVETRVTAQGRYVIAVRRADGSVRWQS